MVVIHGDDAHENEGTGLQRPQDPASMPAPLAAMADALRANAEALHRINESQQKMAETMERTDKSAQIITSTRALNETFRSLSDIQRGLLDAVVERGGLSFGVVMLLVLVFMVLAGLGGFWAAERWGATTRPEQTAAHAAALERAHDLERDMRQLESRHQEAKDAGAQWRTRYDAGAVERARLERERDAARAEKGPLELRIKELEGDVGTQKARLENFLEVKAQADQAGVLQQRNVILEQENRQLTARVEEIETRNKAMQEFFGNKIMEGKLGDPEAIKSIAKELGLYTEPDGPEPKADATGGPVTLTARGRRVLEQQLRRLLPDRDDETMQILSVRAMDGGATLRDVKLGRYRSGRLVNQIEAKSLSIRVDVARDTIELVCKGGYIVTGRPKTERIPIDDEAGYSIFLTDVNFGDWIRRYKYAAAVGETGMLTWKQPPN